MVPHSLHSWGAVRVVNLGTWEKIEEDMFQKGFKHVKAMFQKRPKTFIKVGSRFPQMCSFSLGGQLLARTKRGRWVKDRPCQDRCLGPFGPAERAFQIR